MASVQMFLRERYWSDIASAQMFLANSKWLLEFIECQFDLTILWKVQVITHRCKLHLLSTILIQITDDGILKALRTRLFSIFCHEFTELGGCWLDYDKIRSRGDCCLPMKLGGLIHGMGIRLEVLKPDIQHTYTILTKSSRCKTRATRESVIGHLTSLRITIGYLLQYKAAATNTFKEELEAVEKGLRFLSNFLGFAASMSHKLVKLKDLQILAEMVATGITCLVYLCCDGDKLDDRTISWVKHELLYHVRKIRPAQAEVRKIYINTLQSFRSATCIAETNEFVLGFLESLQENLSELSKDGLGFSDSVKDQVSALQQELRFLECLVVDSAYANHDQKFKDLGKQNNIFIKEAACLIFLFYDDDLTSQRELLLLDLLAKINIAKGNARQLYNTLVPKSLRSNFPQTNAKGFISSLLQNLKQLLCSKGNSIASLKHHVEAVLEELHLLKDDFEKNTKLSNEQQELECHWACFRDAAYQTEHVIDSFLATKGVIWFHKLALFDVIEEIKEIRAMLRPLGRKVTEESKSLQNFSSLPQQISVQLVETSAKVELVVFEPEFEKIMGQLRNGSEKLHILSIVGTPGIGKTTLANSIYQHVSVTNHFHVCATYSVTQAYDPKILLLEILKQVTCGPINCSDEDLDQKVYQNLKCRRYLIFLDDVWDFNLLKNMRNTFPDDENGSRILLTSRLEKITSQAGTESISYCLSPLSNDKSWQMFQSKLFGKESCPKELEKVGQEIVINCRGLPLTIDLVAGFLQKMDRSKDSWLQLSQFMLTESARDPIQRCSQVLEISYNHLPDHLRSCLLLFAGLPRQTSIHARRLEWIWIGEGFVQLPENDERNLEDVAKTYLDELISRNLVMVNRRGSLATVKKTQIHDLIHQFVMNKAVQEGFLLPIDYSSDFSTLSTYGYPWFTQYRLSIYPDYREQFFCSNPSGFRVRSLVFPFSHHSLLTEDNEVFDYPIDLSNFKNLRVFDLEDIDIKQIPPSLPQLIHIRFLIIRSCKQEVLSAILQHLQNLVTLVIRNGCEDLANLSPEDIENMASLRFLRHFNVRGFVFPPISKEAFEKHRVVPFHNLQYVSGLIHCETNHANFLRLMPNLRKLKYGCIHLSGNQNPILNLDFLMNLESLSIRGLLDMEYHTSMFSFPPYLKKLTFKFASLPWTNISALCKLQHLEVLKLISTNSSTDIWDMEELDQKFPKLKHLQLYLLDIKVWNALEENLPSLERLDVMYCQGLKELPICLGDIPTLQEIFLARCCNSLAISADKIKEQQVEQGNEQLVVRKSHLIHDDVEDLSELNDVQGEGILFTSLNEIMNLYSTS